MAKILDDKEQIEKCLNCKRPKCNNCVVNKVVDKKERKPRTGNIDEEEFLRLYNLGYSDKEISQRLNVVRETVTGFRWRRNLAPNENNVTIVRCKHCKKGTVYYHDEEDYYEVVCSLLGSPMAMDDFCSYGERKCDE